MTREKATLVAIDMQVIFGRPDSEWGTVGYEAAEENTRRLAENMAGHVIWTKFVRDPDERGSWVDYYRRWSDSRLEPDSDQWDVTLPIAEEDRVLTLPTFSKWGDELARMTADSDRMIVCGAATDCCVLSTVLGAVDAGRHVTVVTDACAGATTEAHEQALALMNMLSPMITLASTDEVIAANA